MAADDQLSLNFDVAEVLPAEAGPNAFEEFAHDNGIWHWRARWLMERLEYATWASFEKVIGKAQASCGQVNVPIHENFIYDPVIVGGRPEADFKLSRFACFLIAQHADARKKPVEEIRTYLAAMVAAILDAQPSLLERLQERQTLTLGEDEMEKQAVLAGVQGKHMGIFKDAGYRGLYNMSLRALKQRKGLAGKGPLYDHMGLTELAANSFRVTQTAERLKNSQGTGLEVATRVAEETGIEVRAMMAKSGIVPEDLPLESDIKSVKQGLKTVSHTLEEHDKPKKGRRGKTPPSLT